MISKIFNRISPSKLPDMQSRLKYKGLKKLLKAKQSELKNPKSQKKSQAPGAPTVNFTEWVATLNEDK
jgi:hypothetical protein